MNRETITIKLPKSQSEVVLNTDLTGGEHIELETAGYGKTQAKQSTGIEIDTGAVYKRRLQKQVQLIVVSFNGNGDKEFIWNSVQNLFTKDYKFLMKSLALIVDGALDTEEEKKNTESV